MPAFNGALVSPEWRDALWARFSTAAPNDRVAVFRVKRWQAAMACGL